MAALTVVMLCSTCTSSDHTAEKININFMMIRMAELEIDSVYLDQYIVILKEESEASVRLEPDVIYINPMFQKEQPTAIRRWKFMQARPHTKRISRHRILKIKNNNIRDGEIFTPY